MKILTNNSYNELTSRIKALENDKDDLEYQRRLHRFDFDDILNSIYYDLLDLQQNVKQGMKKEKTLSAIHKIILKCGGK